MVDRVAQAEGLLIEQYRDSENLKALIGAATAELQESEQAHIDLLNNRSIDTAIGVNLDIIGRILVIDRPFTDPDPEDVFTFDNPSEIGQGFTNVSGSLLGGYYIGLNPIDNQTYSDSNYRFVLKGKIVFNNTNGSLADMVAYASLLFDVDFVITEKIGSVTLFVARTVGLQERRILEQTFPLPAGISLGSIVTSTGYDTFAFAGDDTGLGFGDSSDAGVGGGLASVNVD